MGEFAKRLKALRVREQLTQDELAPILGISRSTLGMYETGKREPGFEMLENIADFFNVDMNYLVGYSNHLRSWEDIANDEGIAPPNDFKGDPKDWYEMKKRQEQDALIDSYYDSHPNENINESLQEVFPQKIRAAARNMMELSPEDQKTAIDIITFLAQKGREAKTD